MAGCHHLNCQKCSIIHSSQKCLFFAFRLSWLCFGICYHKLMMHSSLWLLWTTFQCTFGLTTTLPVTKKFKHNSPFHDFPVVTVLFFVRLTSVTLKILSLKYNLVIADQILTRFFLIWKDIDSWLTDNSETLRITIMTQEKCFHHLNRIWIVNNICICTGSC